MKATIDLPEKLLRQLKLRALKEERSLKDIVAEFLRKGLAQPTPARAPAFKIIKSKRTGLPVIHSPHAPPPNRPTPEQISQLLADQEIEWFLESA